MANSTRRGIHTPRRYNHTQDTKVTTGTWDANTVMSLDGKSGFVVVSVDEDVLIVIDSSSSAPSGDSFSVWGEGVYTLPTNGNTYLHYKQKTTGGNIWILGG